MILSIIAAVGSNRVIGYNNTLPWKLPDDLAYFKKVTLGKPVIMGRHTWESLPGPLQKRKNLVITRRKDYVAVGADVVLSIEEAISACSGEAEVMLIGGASLYEQTLSVCDRLYLTDVDAAPVGDSFFPEFVKDDWLEVFCEKHLVDNLHAHSFTWRLLERKRIS